MVTAKRQPRSIRLNEERIALFEEQVLRVLADYQSMRPADALSPFRAETLRREIAKRITANLRAVAR